MLQERWHTIYSPYQYHAIQDQQQASMHEVCWFYLPTRQWKTRPQHEVQEHHMLHRLQSKPLISLHNQRLEWSLRSPRPRHLAPSFWMCHKPTIYSPLPWLLGFFVLFFSPPTQLRFPYVQNPWAMVINGIGRRRRRRKSAVHPVDAKLCLLHLEIEWCLH